MKALAAALGFVGRHATLLAAASIVVDLALLTFTLSLGMTTLVVWPAGRARLRHRPDGGQPQHRPDAGGDGLCRVRRRRLYFAVAQFPIDLLPHLMRPIARWATGMPGLDER